MPVAVELLFVIYEKVTLQILHMKTLLKNSVKTILVVLGILLVSFFMAYYVEEYYRRLVRFSFTLFNGDHIRFVGKNFHFFASPAFVIASSLFNTWVFFFLWMTSPSSRSKRAFLVITIFIAATFLITALDSSRLVIECTVCNDRIRPLSYNELKYDNYFIASLSMAVMYLLVGYIVDRKRLKKFKI